MISARDKVLVGLFGSMTAIMIMLAVAGAFRSYSAVPYWDMWDGTADFYMNAKRGNYSAWWAQHNEHRIVFSRVLFWIDYEWFGGASWFLIIINYVLVGLGAFLFWRILRSLTKSESPEVGEILLGLLFTAFLFLWCQHDNFTTGFQNQFFFAQLFPLCAFYWLHKSVSNAAGRRHFLVACCFGVFSIGTMANGLLTLPLMAAYALLMRQGFMRVGALLALSLVTLFLYLFDYVSPQGHGSLSEAVWGNPLGFVHYVLLYVGSPFFYLFGGSSLGKSIAALAGIVLIFGSGFYALKSTNKPREKTLPLALLFFILYVGGTAVGTAGGRLLFGTDQALSARYTTPALMAWVAFVVIYSPPILARMKSAGSKILFPFALLSTLLIGVQSDALFSNTDYLFQRKVAALALALQVKDENQILNVYPNAEHVLTIAQKMSAQHLSVFGTYPFRDLGEQIGSSIRNPRLPPCEGNLDIVEAIVGDEKFFRISGWMFNASTATYPAVIRLADSQDKIVGLALSGQEREDVAKTINKSALFSGFNGYLLASNSGAALTARGDAFCQMQINVPEILYSISKTELSTGVVTVESTSILENNQWLGADFQKTSKDGIQVYGSYIKSDAEMGAISLRIRRGDKIFYRSGPIVARQTMEIVGQVNSSRTLPNSPEWNLLDFSEAKLPDGEFIIKLSDNGSGWGEWSAIAVKKVPNNLESP